MNIQDKANAIYMIRPNAKFTITGDELIWYEQDTIQPTEEEIEAGWVAYQEKEQADKAEKELKRQLLLDKLGITEDEAKILLS
jgi:hypothetical protein